LWETFHGEDPIMGHQHNQGPRLILIPNLIANSISVSK